MRRESPQARTASPADSMFTAAFRSRSCMVWQYGHSHVLTSNVFLPVFLPHVWQIWLLGYHWSMTVSWRPYHSALYSSMVRNCLQLASRMLLFRPLFAFCPLWRYCPGLSGSVFGLQRRLMFLTAKSSMTTVWFSRMILVESL